MELDTRLDRSSYRWLRDEPLSSSDRAALLVEVTAPAMPRQERTTATHLVVVLDRSGSMGGARLQHAQQALCDVIDRLSPRDTFGLVTFDHTVDVVVPAGPATDPHGLKRAVRGVRAGGSTDLAAGLVRGLKEARRLEATEGVRVLLISDGHANVGVEDPAVIGPRVADFVGHGISCSTLGMGLGYDETLLDAVSRAGGGNHHFAGEADTAAGAIGEECGELLGQRFLQCRLTITPATAVTGVEVLNDVVVQPVAGGIAVDLGNLAPEQSRSLVVRFDPRRAIKPGRRKVATVRLSWVLADDLSDQSAQQTVWAHVAAPGERAGRVDRDVVAEVLFQDVQRLKARAAEAVRVHDVAAARRRFDRAIAPIRSAWKTVPLDRRRELEAEIDGMVDSLRRLDEDVVMGSAFVSKSMYAQLNRSSAKRDRRRQSRS